MCLFQVAKNMELLMRIEHFTTAQYLVGESG